MAKPDFFIVGAPRCGTTAMYTYLRKHPQIFMPEHKEPMYFGADLSQLHDRLSDRDYLALFEGAKPGQRVGEATTWYLYSRSAAEEIKAFQPDARIIVMLRNPVEVMYSLHRELLFYRGEVIEDFEEALAAEEVRKQGRRIGPGRRTEALFYRDAVQFSTQLQRYLDAFGPDRVKVIIYDDFIHDTAAAYRDVLRFLEVDESFAPEFVRVNESKVAKNYRLQALIVRPPAPFDRLVPLMRRFELAHRLRSVILNANGRTEKRPQMDEGLRQRLTAEMRPEVERLGKLVGRDLSSWTNAPSPALTA
jgi:hypothetical protein